MTTYEETKKVPDAPETRLAFRVWRCDGSSKMLSSINAGKPARQGTWLAQAISSPEGVWSPGEVKIAECSRGRVHKDGIPDPDCTCGLYATTDLSVVNTYLGDEAPVLGIVELGGRTIPATQGYRARALRVAAILLIDEVFTLPHRILRQIAERYKVDPLIPHSTQPEDYRALIRKSGSQPVDWDEVLRRLLEEENPESQPE